MRNGKHGEEDAGGFSRLLDGFVSNDGRCIAHVDDGWRQGRAIYGGLAASLCVEATVRSIDDLPRLRSAQFAFMGPAAEELDVTPTLLRRGRSTTFVGVDLESEGRLSTRALLSFAADRPSEIAHRALFPPEVPPPGSCPDFFEDRPSPTFARHFEMRRAGGDLPFSGSREPELRIWIRHRDRHVRTGPASSLIVLADAAPPAAITMFGSIAPISSMTWNVELLDLPETCSAADWFLLQSSAVTASKGYSMQMMHLWDEAGNPLMVGSQCVALFL